MVQFEPWLLFKLWRLIKHLWYMQYIRKLKFSIHIGCALCGTYGLVLLKHWDNGFKVYLGHGCMSRSLHVILAFVNVDLVMG
jgi:hypothetical protein